MEAEVVQGEGRKSRRRIALGRFPTTSDDSSLPFVAMVSLEEIPLGVGEVKVQITNIQLITGGDILFLMDVVWKNHKWFLLRHYDEFLKYDFV